MNHITKYRTRYMIYLGYLWGYILLSLIATWVFNPYSNLVSRWLLFTTFILPIALLIRWDDNRIVIVVSFILFNMLTGLHSIFFPSFYSIITPLFPVFYAYRQFLPIISSYNDTIQTILQIARYGYFIDLIIVLSIGGLTSLSFLLLKKALLSTRRRRIILRMFVVLALLIVLFLPYLVVMITGTMHFGLAYSSGAIRLSQGMEVLVEDQDLELVITIFSDAVNEFFLAQDLYFGLEKMGLYNLLLLLEPDFDLILGDAQDLLLSSFILSESFLSTLQGVYIISSSFEKMASEGLEDQDLDQLPTELSTSRQYLNRGSMAFTNALQLILGVNIPEFSKNTARLGVGNFQTELELVRYSGLLFNITLDIFINQISPIQPNNSPLYHALQVILQTRKAQSLISDQSKYSGVEHTFEQLLSNLTVVDLGLNETSNPQFDTLESMDLGGSILLDGVRDQITGIFDFFRDLTDLSMSLGTFGLGMVDVLRTVNQTLIPLVDDLEGFPNIPEDRMKDAILNVDGLRNITYLLSEDAVQIEQKMRLMEERSSSGDYGLFSSQARLLVLILNQFQIGTNANNFYHLISATYFLLQAMQSLQFMVEEYHSIESNISIIEDDPSNAEIVGSSGDSIANSIAKMDNLVLDTRSNLTEAKYHLQQVENMAEADFLLQIIEDIEIQLDLLDYNNLGFLFQLSNLISEISLPVPARLIAEIQQLLDQLADSVFDIEGTVNSIAISGPI
ncbi:MAG: hypothetical protein INQ03_04595 [Candidatus Heimdallarchaeota archaeon]|nr:hypothetical protein [Candidatus Heimdallarchaeota archaeon]